MSTRKTGYAWQGTKPFDVPLVSQIEGNLLQGGVESGLALPFFISNVVSLYPWEEYTLEYEPNTLLRVFMHDSEDQSLDQVNSIAGWVNEMCEDGPTLVHCHSGINRASLINARALMLRGMTAPEAIALIRSQRSPVCLSNPAFEEWLLAQ